MLRRVPLQPSDPCNQMPFHPDLVEAALGDDLEQLVGFLGFVAGHYSCGLGSHRFPAHQNHNIYGLLEERYLRVFIL